MHVPPTQCGWGKMARDGHLDLTRTLPATMRRRRWCRCYLWKTRPLPVPKKADTEKWNLPDAQLPVGGYCWTEARGSGRSPYGSRRIGGGPNPGWGCIKKKRPANTCQVTRRRKSGEKWRERQCLVVVAAA